jgi:hypothetical protein
MTTSGIVGGLGGAAGLDAARGCPVVKSLLSSHTRHFGAFDTCKESGRKREGVRGRCDMLLKMRVPIATCTVCEACVQRQCVIFACERASDR